MDAFLSRWLDSMVAVSWQFSLLFVVVMALTRLFRPWLTPAVRHLLWSLLLLRLAFPFGLEAPFGVAPRPEVWLDRLTGIANSLLAGSTGEDSTQTTPSQRDRGVQSRSDATVAQRRPSFVVSGGRNHGIEHRQAGLSLTSIACFVLWACAVAAMGALHMHRAWRRRPTVLASIESLSAEARSALDRAAAALALRRLPRIALVDEPVAAIRIAGVMKPRLDLPARMNLDWSAADLEPVFLHELAHLKRRDPGTRAACNLLHTLFFFHPLVWIAARQARVERELACDDLAVRRCTSGRRGYVEALLRVAGESNGRLEEPFALAATGHRGGLRYRLSRLVAENYRPTLRTSPAVATGVALALAVGVGGSIYGERPKTPAEERHASHSHSGADRDSERTPEKIRDAHVTLVGGEGREVVDVYAISMRPFPPASRSFYSRPPYLALRTELEAPVDLAGVPEGVYSFRLSFDGEGDVSAVGLDLFLPRESAFAAEEAGDPPAVLADWIDGFELEIPAGWAVEPSALGGLADVEVREGRAELLTRAPAGVDELRSTIEQHYRLAPDRSLDLLPPPYPDTRSALYRFGSPGQARAVPEGPTRLSIALDSEGHPYYLSAAFGCGDLRSLLTTIGYGEHLVEADADLLDRALDADLLVREGTPPEKLLAELEVALRDRIGLEVDLSHSRETRRTVILRGSLRELEPDPRSKDGLAIIEFWGDVATDGTGGSGGMGPAAPMLARVLARATGMPVVDETTDSLDIVSVYSHASPLDERNLDELLRQLEEKTGFEISIESRPSEKVVISARSEAASL